MKQRTYLAASLLGAAAVVNGHRPLVRRGPASVAAGALGWFDSEEAWARAALQGALVLGAARSGLLRTPAGKLATVVNLASMAGALHLYQVARTSGAVLERALLDELGTDYRSRIMWPPSCGNTDAPVVRTRVPAMLTRERKRYVVGEGLNVTYGEAGKRNQLDVWRRADLPPDGRAPVVIQVHGGAWAIGNKQTQALPLLTHLADRGWVCVSINYRLAPRATWPGAIADVLRAVAWTKANVAQFGGDPDFIAITGGSAGGHLSSLAALAAGDPEFQPGFESADTSVQAAVPLYGVYDWVNEYPGNHAELLRLLERAVVKRHLADGRAVFEQASPLARIHPDAPPFFVIHGENDLLVSVDQARTFVGELRKTTSAPVVYAELPFAQHAFELTRSQRAMHTVHAIERFLGVVYGDHQRLS